VAELHGQADDGCKSENTPLLDAFGDPNYRLYLANERSANNGFHPGGQCHLFATRRFLIPRSGCYRMVWGASYIPRRKILKPACGASSFSRWQRCQPLQNAHVLHVRSAFEAAHVLPSNKI